MKTLQEVFWVQGSEQNVRKLGWIRIYFLLVFLYPVFMRDAGRLWHSLHAGPIFFLALGWTAFVLALIGFKTRWSMALLTLYVVVVGTAQYNVMQGYNFNYVDLLCLSLLFLPLGASLSVDAWLIRKKAAPAPTTIFSWPKAPGITLVLFYWIAGLEKLRTSGLNWVDGETLRSYILMRATLMGQELLNPLQSWMVHHVGWCQVAQGLMLMAELTFPLILLVRWSRWIFVPFMMVFHWICLPLFGFTFPIWLCLPIFLL